MRKVILTCAVLALSVSASAYTWPDGFPYDGLITNDRAGLPMPSRSIHIHGGFFYYDVLNKHFDRDGDSIDDRADNYTLGAPFSLGYTFDGLWSFDVTGQYLRSNTKGFWVDPDADNPDTPEDERVWDPNKWRHESGLGDVWIKVRKLFIAGDGFYVGPRVGVKVPGGNANTDLGDGQIDIDGGLVLSKFSDTMFKINGQAGFRYRMETYEDSEVYKTTPGSLIYVNAEPGIGIGEDHKFVLYVPIGFGYHMESETNGNKNDDAGYGLAIGAKPTYAINDNHTIGATVLYPVMGKNVNQELYVGIAFDSFIPLPEPVKDTDGDGIKDNKDACIHDPEDFDNFEDSDGCPEPDNDNDGILDADDNCPNEAETFNGFEDNDGCPDTKPEPPKEIILNDLRFVPESTELVSGSYASLDKAGKTLEENPEITVTIEGHAADTGRPDFEMKLSEGRAVAVKDYIVDKYGIDASRIKTKGYGSTKPIADNSTEEGKRQNRRIEFKVD